MAGLIAQYQQGTFTTPVNATTADASVVLSNDNNVRTKHNSHDNDATIHVQSSALASRPAASVAQRLWVTTDTLRFFVDSGSVWNELNYITSTTPTITSATLVTPTVSGTMTLGSTDVIKWTSRNTIGSSADSIVQFLNNAGTGFGSLLLGLNTQFGGIRLNHNGAGAFRVQAGDGSGFTDLLAANITASLTLVTTGSGILGQLDLNQNATALGAAGYAIRIQGLTSGAAASAGTLTNAPSAGNPSFWMPININGSVRYIPCWT